MSKKSKTKQNAFKSRNCGITILNIKFTVMLCNICSLKCNMHMSFHVTFSLYYGPVNLVCFIIRAKNISDLIG